jgi:hypothetical protein
MIKFFTNKKTAVTPINYEERKIEWNIRSINSILPEQQLKNPNPKIKF